MFINFIGLKVNILIIFKKIRHNREMYNNFEILAKCI